MKRKEVEQEEQEEEEKKEWTTFYRNDLLELQSCYQEELEDKSFLCFEPLLR
jgi:hypothetical protein